MSEYTEAFLVMEKDKHAATTALDGYPHPVIVRELNAKWFAIFPEHVDYSLRPFLDWMLERSTFPMLYFQDPADHGWGYNLYTYGKEITALYVNYDLQYNLWRDRAEQLYPRLDPHGPVNREVRERLDRLHDEVKASDEFRRVANAQFESANVEAFRVFGFDDETVSALQDIVDVAWYLDPARRHEQVHAFKRAIGITELNWMSYRYLSRE